MGGADMQERYRLDEEDFADAREHNPDLTYAQFSMTKQAVWIEKGNHHASLGGTIRGYEEDWWRAGVPMFRAYNRMLNITPVSRIVEYGCGSLRVGAHFIKYLKPENYIGLDVIRDFIDDGVVKLGPLMDEKSLTSM